MKRNICTTLGLLLLSSCISQSPAPIEFGSSKSNTSSGHSERTESKPLGGEIVSRRDLVVKKPEPYPTGELEQKDEAFVDYVEKKPHPEPQPESESEPQPTAVLVEEKELKKTQIKEDKKLKSLEEELEEIEEQNEDATPSPLPPNDEVVMPEKVVIEDGSQQVSDLKFVMPVSGKIITNFGEDKGGKKSSGINISATRGADVKSVAAGKVVYACHDPKFGNLVIVKVGSTEIFAAYAHMDDMLLQKDDDVAKGQVIGHVGSTGDSTSPELHFALRKGKTPVDPLRYLIQK